MCDQSKVVIPVLYQTNTPSTASYKTMLEVKFVLIKIHCI